MIRRDVSYQCFFLCFFFSKKSYHRFIHPPWSRVADRLALCQVLAEGALSARDGRGWVEVCLMVWRGGGEGERREGKRGWRGEYTLP